MKSTKVKISEAMIRVTEFNQVVWLETDTSYVEVIYKTFFTEGNGVTYVVVFSKDVILAGEYIVVPLSHIRLKERRKGKERRQSCSI